MSDDCPRYYKYILWLNRSKLFTVVLEDTEDLQISSKPLLQLHILILPLNVIQLKEKLELLKSLSLMVETELLSGSKAERRLSTDTLPSLLLLKPTYDPPLKNER